MAEAQELYGPLAKLQGVNEEIRDLLAKLIPIFDDPELTVRDQFAVAALPAVIQSASSLETGMGMTATRAQIIAKKSYLLAEAMMNERDRIQLESLTEPS